MADKVVQLTDKDGNNIFPTTQKNITMTDVDPGEGSALAVDNYIAVYGGASSMLDLFYPVGTCYETYDTSFNPNNSLGGVWEEDTSYTLVAYAYTSGGSGATVKASKNLSSFTRNSTGAYIFNFAKPMADTNYVVSINSEASGTGAELVGAYNRTTSKFQLDFVNLSGSLVDQKEISISVLGRLASPESRRWRRVV